ncbi:pectinesterase 2-like [Henckelia pumila]|uniref:pectinesterase 2-like n=1 Tax=Henckelia pumila TaxID=405737 RepID=UPI003C6E0A02
MAPKTLITIFLAFSFFKQAISMSSNSTIKYWCSQTPYPQPCEDLFSHKYPNKAIKSKSDFFKLSKELALDRCVAARDNLRSLGPKCRNKREKAAWADCVELYHGTVRKLNQTIDPNVKHRRSSDDVQTWLSTALTNLDTCRTGFVELGVTDFVLPLISNNVSMFLSNTLALNDVGGEFDHQHMSYYKKGFPTWVRHGDRKLMEASNPQANVVVAQDGSGQYTTVSEAISAAGQRSGSGRYVIYVKQGTYKENVNVGSGLQNIMLYGDGIGQTVITGSRSVGGGTTTFNSATFAVIGDGFISRGITFRNTAGASNHQAVALRSGADLSVFYECSFEGYQDTLYVHSERQFFKECNIYGTVDFIFGNSAVVFQNCYLFPRYPPNGINTITAQGRSDPNQNTGISIQSCRVTAASDLKPVQSSVQTYLGRPWQRYSRTVFMETFLDSLIAPAGWFPWNGNFALETLYYGEYANMGPGSSTANRVEWEGYHVITSAAVASQFTAGSFIDGKNWLPDTGVPFTSGL